MNPTYSITDLCMRANNTAVNKGFWEGQDCSDPIVQLAKIALIMSELGEAVEAIRKEDKQNLTEELADVCIRIFDFSVKLELELESTLIRKMLFNESRPFKHGKLA